MTAMNQSAHDPATRLAELPGDLVLDDLYWPPFLLSGREIAGHVAGIASDHVDERFVADMFDGTGVVLCRVPLGSIFSGSEDRNLASGEKQAAYALRDPASRPPSLISENGEMWDGNHRLRDARGRGETHLLCYVALDEEKVRALAAHHAEAIDQINLKRDSALQRFVCSRSADLFKGGETVRCAYADREAIATAPGVVKTMELVDGRRVRVSVARRAEGGEARHETTLLVERPHSPLAAERDYLAAIGRRLPAPGTVAELIFERGLEAVRGLPIQDGADVLYVRNALIDRLLLQYAEDGLSSRAAWQERLDGGTAPDAEMVRWIHPNTVRPLGPPSEEGRDAEVDDDNPEP